MLCRLGTGRTMRLDLVMHCALVIPDELIGQVREDRLPDILKRLLWAEVDRLPVTISLLTRGVEGAYVVPLQVGSVEWRSDLAARVLRQIRDAAETARVVGLDGDYDETPSVLDRRCR